MKNVQKSAVCKRSGLTEIPSDLDPTLQRKSNNSVFLTHNPPWVPGGTSQQKVEKITKNIP